MTTEGINWLEWNDETEELLNERWMPIFIFVDDPDNAAVAPFLREISNALEKDAKILGLLKETFPALRVHANSLPEYLAFLREAFYYHIAVLSPSGFTPLITFEPIGGDIKELITEIGKALEAIRDTWSTE